MRQARTLPHSRTRAISLLALFAAIQVADASITLAGVRRFGPSAEANTILRFYIVTFGAIPTLLTAKSVALVLGTVMYSHARYFAMAILTLVYVICAIDTWALVPF